MGQQVFQRNVFQNRLGNTPAVFQLGIGPLGPYGSGNFYFLQDHTINGHPSGRFYFTAGTTANVSGAAWYPTADVDPLDVNAVNSFYTKGPQVTNLVRTQWSITTINSPKTYWVEIGPYLWALTGLGSNRVTYPPVQLSSPFQPHVFQKNVFQHNVFQTQDSLQSAVLDRSGNYPTGAG